MSSSGSARDFWDGGLLRNTPLRELLDAHQEYWKDVENKDEIPELEVYIVNVHPSKIDDDKIPKDHDGVKDRQNDIMYGDRTSRYDENVAHLITDYTNFVTKMKDLAKAAISKVNDIELQEQFQNILETKTISKDRKGGGRKYENLTKQFKLTKVARIERTNYINSIYGKTGDLTLPTINKLIKEGEIDAWFSLIQNHIDDMELAANIKDSLTVKLNEAMENLKSNDYEDTDSQTYRMLSEFI
jgi:NTE family protein